MERGTQRVSERDHREIAVNTTSINISPYLSRERGGRKPRESEGAES